MSIAFTDTGQTLEDFADTIFVSCPRCHKCAHVRRVTTAQASARSAATAFARCFSPRKLSCLHCGYSHSWEGHVLQRRDGYDWYFRLPLWLQTPCCDSVLWAFNEDHLYFLESYVAARQRLTSLQGRLKNTTMASRLPLWIKTAKNRETVLKGIKRLKKLADER